MATVLDDAPVPHDDDSIGMPRRRSRAWRDDSRIVPDMQMPAPFDAGICECPMWVES